MVIVSRRYVVSDIKGIDQQRKVLHQEPSGPRLRNDPLMNALLVIFRRK